MGKLSKDRGIRANRVPFFFFLALALPGCALFATRPTQEMSDTAAAIRAAHEVQADSLAPELLRQAKEWYLRARTQYKLKNFAEASEYARRARKFAEQAEFEAIRNGGNRVQSANDPSSPFVQAPPPPPPEPVFIPTTTPEPLPTPEGVLHRPDETPVPATPASTPEPPPSSPTPPPPQTY